MFSIAACDEKLFSAFAPAIAMYEPSLVPS